jgi:hypothetical protein
VGFQTLVIIFKWCFSIAKLLCFLQQLNLYNVYMLGIFLFLFVQMTNIMIIFESGLDCDHKGVPPANLSLRCINTSKFTPQTYFAHVCLFRGYGEIQKRNPINAEGYQTCKLYFNKYICECLLSTQVTQ